MSVILEVTEEAKHQVQELIRAQKTGTAVRVFVQSGGGGGCGSGGRFVAGAGKTLLLTGTSISHAPALAMR